MSRRGRGHPPSGGAQSFPGFAAQPPTPLDASALTPPDPSSVVDHQYIEELAASSCRGEVELHGENAKYHDRRARSAYAETQRAASAELTQRTWELNQRRPNLEQVQAQKQAQKRFVGKSQHTDGRQAASGFEYAKFAALVTLLVVAVANGTMTVASVMLATPAFEGSPIKAASSGLGLFLMPSVGFFMPFYLLSSRPRLAKTYLFLLSALGLGSFGLFALTWAHQYAMESGNQLLLDLTTIGMASSAPESDDLPWIFANASWLSLLCNILADAAFAGSAKAGLTLLSSSHALFRRKALQDDPEWARLHAAEQDLITQIGQLQGAKTAAAEQLEALNHRELDYADAVCAVAHAALLSALDRQELKRRELEALEADLDRQRARVEQQEAARQEYLQTHPGLLQKGPQRHEENA